jgi:hypothetical protein
MCTFQGDLTKQVVKESYLQECIANTQFTVEWILSGLNANDKKWLCRNNKAHKIREVRTTALNN